VSVLSLVSIAAESADRRLADASKNQDQAAIRALLHEHADVNARHPDGATALHWAAHWDDLETARLLIRAGAELNPVNDLGVTPLSLACTNGNAAMAAALLEAGANPNLALTTGETPLMTAAYTGNAAIVRVLLARGADVDGKEASQGQTALMWAVSEQHTDATSTLLEYGADVLARSQGGFTPLMFASRLGNLELAGTLIAAGADVNDTAADGSTPLLVATVRGHVAFAKFLLENGANPNAHGAGYTALHWAAGSWETELTGPHGVMLQRDQDWKSLRGLETEKLELVTALLGHGADPNAHLVKSPPRFGFSVFRVNLDGATPFFLAAMAGDAKVMRALAAAGADQRQGTKDNTTPLMAAAGVGRVLAETRVTPSSSLEAAKLAWELGGDVHATNAAGETALHGAAHIRADALVQFLVDKGAALNVKNRRGETPLMIAERTVAAGSAPVYVRTSTGDLLRRLGANAVPDVAPK
jgi:ankyrin repeat protein